MFTGILFLLILVSVVCSLVDVHATSICTRSGIANRRICTWTAAHKSLSHRKYTFSDIHSPIINRIFRNSNWFFFVLCVRCQIDIFVTVFVLTSSLVFDSYFKKESIFVFAVVVFVRYACNIRRIVAFAEVATFKCIEHLGKGGREKKNTLAFRPGRNVTKHKFHDHDRNGNRRTTVQRCVSGHKIYMYTV